MVTLTLVRYGDLPYNIDYNPITGDLLFVHAKVLEQLLLRGWTTIDRVFRIPATLIQAGHGQRDLARLTLPELKERAYLKRELGTYRKDRLSAFVLAGRYTTKCVQEFVALRHLRRHGVTVPSPLALWLHRNGSRVQAALLLEELRDYEPLDLELARARRALRERPEQLDRIACALAEFVARVHDALVHDPDLFAWHVLVRASRLGDDSICPDDFALIDLQRALVLAWKPCCVRRARDIAALFASIDDDCFPAESRRRFLAHYFETARPRDPWRPIFPRVLARRIARWRSRRKVREALQLQQDIAQEVSEPSVTQAS